MICGFQELTGSLQDLISQALVHIKGQETGITAIKLASLQLEGQPTVCFFSSSCIFLVEFSSCHTLSFPSIFSGGSFIHEGCYGQGAEQLPALITGGWRSSKEKSRNNKKPQDLNAIIHTPNKDIHSHATVCQTSSYHSSQRKTHLSISPHRPGSLQISHSASVSSAWRFFFFFFTF